jgi:hypothetical protein
LILSFLGITWSKVVVDSIAALARKEGFNERDKEEFFISQVRACACVLVLSWLVLKQNRHRRS